MIAIPNMDKPKGCVDCPVNDLACELWTEVANIKTHIHKDCPLIDIMPCGECKWYEPYDSTRPYDCPRGMRQVNADDFCSYGERRSE